MKDTFFFPHDFGARNDPKLQNVLMEHGCEGLGTFWCIVEQIYEQGGSLPLSSCKTIAFALHVDCKVVQSIVNDFDLFQDDGEIFWSESINNRLNKRAEIAEKRKKAALKRWGSVDESKCNANAVQDYAIKEKERKEKDIKEKKNKGKKESDKSDKSDLGSKDNSKENQFDKYLTDIVDEWKEVVVCWLTYKKNKNQSYKDANSVRLFCEKLKRYSGDDEMVSWRVIEQSMSNNWNGIFELKQEYNEQQGSITSAQGKMGFGNSGNRANTYRNNADERRNERSRLKDLCGAILQQP